MKKDKEWLKEELLRELMLFNGNPNMTDYESGIASGIMTAINLTEKLDEPEITFEQAHDKLREESILSEKSFDYYWNCINDNVEIDEPGNLLVPKQDKPVIPEWLHKIFSCERDAIQRKYVNPWIVEEVAKTKSYVDNDLKPKPALFKDEKQCEYVADNYEMIINAIFNGYEVEKEKLYRVRAGNRYVRFNLDGSIIGVKKDNSIVRLERLSKLPFDYKKAVESGIITLEEVTE